MPFIWPQDDWPRFKWDAERCLEPLASARAKHGYFLGRVGALGFEVPQRAELESLVEEVVKSSDIEGERLDPARVRSSAARQLGLPYAGLPAPDRRIDGVVEMTADATRRFDEPLTAERIWGWHAALFPAGYSGFHKIRVAGWRSDESGPMRVVSGRVDRPRVHFEAPPADRVPEEMTAFLGWFNGPQKFDGLVRASLAHLWFVTVHPLEDGNGRIARTITDLAVAQLERSPHRYFSLSAQIRHERDDYYDALERTQRGDLDVTSWLRWFLGCFERSIDRAEVSLTHVLARAEFWRAHAEASFNDRQRKVLNLLLDEFEGKLTAKKWAALNRCSIDTAQRDLNDLVTRGVLVRNPGAARNTSYRLAPGPFVAPS